MASLLHDLGRDAEAEQTFLQPIGYHITALRQQARGAVADHHRWGAVDLLQCLILFQADTGQAARARQTLADALRVFPGCPPLLEMHKRLGEKR